MISILLRIFPCNDCRIFMVQSFCYMLIIQPYYFSSTSCCFYTISFICFSAYRNHVFLFADSIFSQFLISSFISLCSFSIFFTNTDSSQMVYESIKVLEIKISTVFNLVFAINTILSCFFIFFLITDLYFLIAAVNVQIFKPVAESTITIRITTN